MRLAVCLYRQSRRSPGRSSAFRYGFATVLTFALVEIADIFNTEVIPKRCYREGVSPSRTLPRPGAYPVESRFIPLAQMADT